MADEVMLGIEARGDDMVITMRLGPPIANQPLFQAIVAFEIASWHSPRCGDHRL